jgi:selenocysteine lyase/cysteine desulfurase
MLPGSLSTVTVAELRQREFARLDARDEAYLDYTGSGLPFESHLRWHLELLRTEVFGNPHSENPPSLASTRWVTDARAAALAFVDAEPAEYDVVFTANASAAIKLVGESFPLEASSRLVLTADNHNSVLGTREFARRAGASVSYVPLDDELRLHAAGQVLGETAPGSASLFAYPAQSNFSGVRHPLTLVRMAHSLGYAVLLDAAAFVPSARLSLRDVPADFVTLSFYKVFGYPTGVGALVVRREWLERLRRPWFAGGTVEFSSVQNDVHLLRRGAEGFEDGTPDFLALSAVSSGLARIADIGIDRIGEHVKTMTARLLEGLLALRHAGGSPLVTVYGPRNLEARGGTVAFNLIDRHGRWIHHADVEARAAARRVSVRSGCFCNPGAGEHALRFDPGRVASCIAAARDDTRDPRFSKDEFARCMGDTPIGAVRASVGIATSERDVERLLDALKEWRN